MTDASNTEPLSIPGEASVEERHVLLDGPGGIAITLTPEAAIITGERLIAAGKKAKGE